MKNNDLITLKMLCYQMHQYQINCIILETDTKNAFNS